VILKPVDRRAGRRGGAGRRRCAGARRCRGRGAGARRARLARARDKPQ